MVVAKDENYFYGYYCSTKQKSCYLATFKLDKNLRKLKYIISIVFVIILPLFLVDILGQGSPYFCKLISPIGMLGLWELFIQLLAQFQYSGID